MNVGRPRASSRATLAEAACELFLEQGFDATSVADITSRAGVSRSSFFNYFASKGDVFWASFDERLDAVRAALAASSDIHVGSAIGDALRRFGDDFAPDALALAFVNADAMGIAGELEREASVRRARIATAVALRLRADGTPAIAAEVAGAAHAGAVLAAIEAWAHEGAGRAPLERPLREALDVAARTLPHS